MKKVFISLFIAFMFANAIAQNGGMTAYFSYCTFNQPAGSPFIETYLSVIGNTVKFSSNEKQKLQSKIEVQWVLKQLDSSGDKIAFFDKYNLLSPELDNETAVKPNFFDQKRLPAA